jgi:zinc transporter ZupT
VGAVPAVTRRRYERAHESADGKGRGFAGETDQIATAMAADNLPDGFALAVAELYRGFSQSG